MKNLRILDGKKILFVTAHLVFLCVLFIVKTDGNATERLVSLKIGPVWPSATSTSWDGELMYGSFIDKKVGFGIAADILWNTNAVDSVDTAMVHTTIRDESHYMFPIMGFIVFDPIPHAIVHPMLRFEIGYNSMIYNYTSRIAETTPSRSGYYYGLIVKLGIDGLYNVGEQTAIFAGLDYQWADTRNAADSAGRFYRRDMSGIGIRMGFRFLL